jgi:hypothetical protein
LFQTGRKLTITVLSLTEGWRLTPKLVVKLATTHTSKPYLKANHGKIEAGGPKLKVKVSRSTQAQRLVISGVAGDLKSVHHIHKEEVNLQGPLKPASIRYTGRIGSVGMPI